MSRGTWQGNGTFQTGGPDPAVVIAVLTGVLLIGGSGAAVAHAVTSVLVIAAVVVGVLIAVAVTVVFFALRATRRREAAYEASGRHQRIMATAAEIKAKPQVTQEAPVPAIEQHVHYHYYAADAPPAFRVIPGEVQR